MNKGRSDFLSFLITREALYILGWALLSMVVAYGLSTQTNDVLELVKESLMFAALFAVVAGFFYWRSSKTTTSKKTAADTKVDTHNLAWFQAKYPQVVANTRKRNGRLSPEALTVILNREFAELGADGMNLREKHGGIPYKDIPGEFKILSQANILSGREVTFVESPHDRRTRAPAAARTVRRTQKARPASGSQPQTRKMSNEQIMMIAIVVMAAAAVLLVIAQIDFTMILVAGFFLLVGGGYAMRKKWIPTPKFLKSPIGLAAVILLAIFLLVALVSASPLGALLARIPVGNSAANGSALPVVAEVNDPTATNTPTPEPVVLTEPDLSGIKPVDIRQDVENAGYSELDSVADSINQWVAVLSATVDEMEARGEDGIDVDPLLIGEGGVGFIAAYEKIARWYDSGFVSLEGAEVNGRFDERVGRMLEEGYLDAVQAAQLKLAGKAEFDAATYMVDAVKSMRWEGETSPNWEMVRSNMALFNDAVYRYNLAVAGHTSSLLLSNLNIVDRLVKAAERETVRMTATPLPGGNGGETLATNTPFAAFTDTPILPTSTATPPPTATPVPAGATEPLPEWCRSNGEFVEGDGWKKVHKADGVTRASHLTCGKGIAVIEWQTADGAQYWAFSEVWPTNIADGTPWVPTKTCELNICFGYKLWEAPTPVPPLPTNTPFVLPTDVPTLAVPPTATNVPPPTQVPDKPCTPRGMQVDVSDPWYALHTTIAVNWAMNGSCNGKYYITWVTIHSIQQWAWASYIPDKLFTWEKYLPLGLGEKWKPGFNCSSIDVDPNCFVALPYE